LEYIFNNGSYKAIFLLLLYANSSENLLTITFLVFILNKKLIFCWLSR